MSSTSDSLGSTPASPTYAAPPAYPQYRPGPTGGGSSSPDQSLRDLLRRILRRKSLLAGVSVGIFILVAAYTFLATPRYRSVARLRIDTESNGPPGLAALASQATASVPGASLLNLGRDELETEISVLKSDRVADAMIDSLALGVRVTKPAASRAAVLSARVIDPSVDADGALSLTRREDGRYDAVRSKLDSVGPLPTVMSPGVPITVGGTRVTLATTLATAGPKRITIKFLPRYKVHKLLKSRLQISQQEGGSRLVEIAFEDPDRALAVQVVNHVVGEYVAYTTRTDRTSDTITVDRLRIEVDSTMRLLKASEATLRAFEERTGLISPKDQASAVVKRMAAISAKVDAVSTERNALARMLTLIDERSKGGTDATAYRQLATFPSLITNRAIQDLLQNLVQLENQRSALGVRRTEQNPEYKQLTDRIVEIERQLYTVGPQYLESLDRQLDMTVRTVTAINDTVKTMPGAEMQYGRLLRDRTVYESTYVALLKQLKVAELRDVLRQDKVRVVDIPRLANPDDRAFPKKAVMLVLGVVLGIFVALVAALLAELWQEPVRVGGT